MRIHMDFVGASQQLLRSVLNHAASTQYIQLDIVSFWCLRRAVKKITLFNNNFRGSIVSAELRWRRGQKFT